MGSEDNDKKGDCKQRRSLEEMLELIRKYPLALKQGEPTPPKEWKFFDPSQAEYSLPPMMYSP